MREYECKSERENNMEMSREWDSGAEICLKMRGRKQGRRCCQEEEERRRSRNGSEGGKEEEQPATRRNTTTTITAKLVATIAESSFHQIYTKLGPQGKGLCTLRSFPLGLCGAPKGKGLCTLRSFHWDLWGPLFFWGFFWVYCSLRATTTISSGGSTLLIIMANPLIQFG